MSAETRIYVAAHRPIYEEKIESWVRLMKIEGAQLEDLVAELNILADFVRAQADGLAEAWPTLLDDTIYMMHQRGESIGGKTADG